MTGRTKKPGATTRMLNQIEPMASKLSRRQFMERALAAGMTVAAATHLWSERTIAATRKSGGHFRAGLNNANTSDVLDTAKMSSEYQVQITMACRNLLVEMNSENVAEPELAESWEASADAKTWRLKIRKGVEFHNGKSLTANDVMATLNYHRAEKSESVVKPLLAGVADISLDGDDTVVVSLSAGNADFPYILTDWHMGILPSDGEGNVDAASGIGTGGYAITTHEAGVRTELKRNANYWKPDRASFDEVSFIGINDVAARQNALVTGKVDAIVEVDIKTASLLAKDANIELDEVASGAAVTMPMHVDVAPFDDNNVRLALKHCIDREQILQTVFQGHGTVGNDHPIGPVLPFWSDMEQRQYDPDKAKHYLQQAGAEGLSVQLSAADAAFAGAVDVATLFAEHAKAAGVNVKIVREPDDGYWSNVWLKKPFCMSYWSGRATPDAIYTLAYSKGSDWNESHYRGENFNELMVQARAELDNAKRTELYAEMQRIYSDEGGSIIPMFRNFLFARRSNVHRDEGLTGNLTLDGARAAERWWFA